MPINDYPMRESFAEALVGFGGLVTRVELLCELANDNEAMLLYDMDVKGLGKMRVAEHFGHAVLSEPPIRDPGERPGQRGRRGHLRLRQQRRRPPQRHEQDDRQRPGEQDRDVQLRQERQHHRVADAQPTATASTGRLSCPSGQTLQLALVSYTNVAITDTTNGVTEPIPGAVSGCLPPNVRKAC